MPKKAMPHTLPGPLAKEPDRAGAINRQAQPMSESESLGLIAGSKSLPLLIAREARASGIDKIVAVAFEGETDPSITELADKVVWLRVGQLSRLISAFKDEGIKRCVMAGQIAPSNLFNLRPDLRAVSLLLRLKEKNAHTIFGGIADELEKDGVKLVEAIPWLKPHMPGGGFLIGRKLSSEQTEDVQYGFQIAKEISRLEIGQCVVVKNGTVLAVEGLEGTNACLERGGSLAGKKGGAVAVKVAKPSHDLRFDIPCIGKQTVETAAKAGIEVLALEAGKTVLLEENEVRDSARKLGIVILTVSTAADSQPG
jgi:DUF1009 family protein